jgi:ribosomal protein L39E
MKKISKDYWMRILNDGCDVFEQRYDNKRALKLAWIRVGRTRKMCFVDTKTMKAYKMDRREPTWIQIKHFTSERWCTGFDM